MTIHTESVKYTFEGSELVELARAQARHMSDVREAEEQLNNVKADHKATITKLEADISKCNLRITSGYEMRAVKCLVLKFRPDGDHALVVRTDNGRVLRRRKLESDEKQLTLVAGEPIPYTFEADFFEDREGDVAEMVADHVPLTTKEAEELRDCKLTLRPLRALIDAPAEESKPAKKGKGQ